jgi:hypothetical protein
VFGCIITSARANILAQIGEQLDNAQICKQSNQLLRRNKTVESGTSDRLPNFADFA